MVEKKEAEASQITFYLLGALSLPPPDGFPVVLGQPPLPFPM